jgi:hypothetical protein
MKPFRIGSGAGYSGDRIDPAQDLAERGALNALVFECLAERTIALAQLRRSHDPQAATTRLLAARMRAVLPACVRQGVTIITNMGAANPLAAGQAVLQVARELGALARLRVAVVTGDDVLAWMQANDAPLMDSNATVRSLDGQLISANAYLGADALLPALRSGADVVITGRVADPALFLAPLMFHFGWQPDDWQRMGQGIVRGPSAGMRGPGQRRLHRRPGLCGCAPPGHGGLSAGRGECRRQLHRVTKLAGTGGRVDRLTCTAQLLYELEDPQNYLQPDVVADFSGVHLTRNRPGPRGGRSGATGQARPTHLKATLGYREGFIGEGQISYAGPGARARGELALAVLEHRLKTLGLTTWSTAPS